jgi:hypothetical protein
VNCEETVASTQRLVAPYWFLPLSSSSVSLKSYVQAVYDAERWWSIELPHASMDATPRKSAGVFSEHRIVKCTSSSIANTRIHDVRSLSSHKSAVGWSAMVCILVIAQLRTFASQQRLIQKVFS